nr:MAG TPA: hypothetical protein [Caudoviricetes sp.]
MKKKQLSRWTRSQWSSYRKLRRYYNRKLRRYIKRNEHPYDYGSILYVLYLMMVDRVNYWGEEIDVHSTPEVSYHLYDIADTARNLFCRAIMAVEGKSDKDIPEDAVKAAFNYLGEHLTELWD